MTETVAKPLPNISDFNRPFWEAARKHEFHLQHCNACSKVWAPNGPVCPYCFSTDYRWEKLSGRGKVASWVVFHKLYHPGFASDIPYNVAFIELSEGPRIIANVVGMTNEDMTIGMPVEATFEDVNAQISIPRFRRVS
jgi:uncharacterized OB-fold protein